MFISFHAIYIRVWWRGSYWKDNSCEHKCGYFAGRYLKDYY